MTNLGNRPKPAAQILAVVFTLSVIAGIGFIHFPSDGEDTKDYRNLMLGNWGRVTQPFSSRFLHPELVALVMRTLKISDQPAATGVAIVTLVVTVLGMALIFRRMNVSVFLLLPTIFGFTFFDSFQLIYMPDLFYTALLIVLFLLLQYEQFLLAAFTIFVLYCTRESTLVLGVVLTGLSILKARGFTGERSQPGAWRASIAFFSATVVGFAFNRYITNKSASNVHHLNGLVYMFGKMPFCFLKNVLGIEMWSDTLVGTEGDSPICKLTLPHWAQLGHVHEIGVAEFSVRYPLLWLIYLLCTFGVLWTVMARVLAIRLSSAQAGRKGWARKVSAMGQALWMMVLAEPFYSQVAFALGLINWIIVPVLGSAVHRYTFYAWPIFWITAVRFFNREAWAPSADRFRGTFLLLLVIHEFLMWVMVMRRWFDPGALILFILLPVCVVLHVIAWKCIGRISGVGRTTISDGGVVSDWREHEGRERPQAS